MLLLSATPSLVAEESAPSRSFRFFTWDKADATPLVVDTTTGEKPLDRPSNRFGIPVRLRTRDDGMIAVHTAPPVDAKPAAPAANPPPAFVFKPGTEARQLVVVLPFGKERRARVFADDEAGFPYGSTMVVNMTRSVVDFGIGGAKSEIRPGAFHVLKPATDTPDTQVTVRQSKDGDSKLIYATMWVSRKDVRNLVFLYESAPGEVLVRTVMDRYSEVTAIAPEDKPAKGKPVSGKR